MKRIRNILIIMLMPILISSCGNMFGFEEYHSPSSIMISHSVIDIAVGDSILFDTKVIPDTLPVNYLWSASGDTNAIELVGRRLLAKQAGEVTVRVEVKNARSSSDSILNDVIADSCVVNVFEWSTSTTGEYLYETVVYASLELDGESFTQELGDAQLVAVVGDEVRGVAVERSVYVEQLGKEVPYLEMRIQSSWPGETATLQCYHTSKYQRFVFHDIQLHGGTYGTLSGLVKLQGFSKY